jgi:hypothetical protein
MIRLRPLRMLMGLLLRSLKGVGICSVNQGQGTASRCPFSFTQPLEYP